MSRPLSIVESPTRQGPVTSFLEALSRTAFFQGEDEPESFASLLRYYKHRARSGSWGFRGAGIPALALSTTLPFWAAYGPKLFGWSDDTKDVIVAAMSSAIALLGGLSAFFKWDSRWRGQTEAFLAMQGLRATWEQQRALALVTPDDAEAVKLLASAAQEFMAATYRIVHAEASDFFKAQAFPEVKQSA